MRSDPEFRIRHTFRIGRRSANRRGRNRRRGASLTFAGRAVGFLILLGLVGLGWGGRAGWRSLQNWRVPDVSELPAVSAPPPLTPISQTWIADPPRSRERFSLAREQAKQIDPSAGPRLVEWLDPVGSASFRWRGNGSLGAIGSSADEHPLRVEYSLDEKLTENVFEILRRGRVERGIAVVLDPRSGRLLAYISTDPVALPPERTYPAASIVKVLTAASLLEEAPAEAELPCFYRGNKYRLYSKRLARAVSGNETSLPKALANSNNQCFAQWAIHVLGEEKLHATFERFGWLAPPAPGHDAGRVKSVTTKLELGRLGSGLAGVSVNPLHLATLASILTGGRWIEPWWIDRVVDAEGHSLELPTRPDTRPVISLDVARQLRAMMVGTTTRGTAKRAFRTRRGRPLIPGIDVAGKTGNLTGGEPFGRYEWFLGLAPAEAPTIAVVVLQVQSNLWWSRSSELAARVLRSVFCEGKECRAQLADRWTGDLHGLTKPLLISELDRRLLVSRAD